MIACEIAVYPILVAFSLICSNVSNEGRSETYIFTSDIFIDGHNAKFHLMNYLFSASSLFQCRLPPLSAAMLCRCKDNI